MRLLTLLVFFVTFIAGILFNPVLTEEEAIKNIVGIDLGTTYSCVGHFKDGGVEIISNEQGNRITPSVVAFTAQDERLVGDSAKNQIITNPENTIFDSKRLIGRSFSDENIKKDMTYWPFKVIAKNNKPNVVVTLNGKEKVFSPEEISAMVLRKMKEIAEAFLEVEVNHAVVTVPAYFNDAQRQATKDAGAIANLNIVRIINEPTAAAIAYGFNKKDEEQNILVFDLGGGTFDVSLLTIDNGVFEVIATNGDTHLGGQDFDNRVFDYVVKEIKSKNKVDISKNVRACQRIKRECEKAKRTLSKAHQTEIELDDLLGDGELDVNIKLSRAKFNELNMDYFQDTLRPVQKVLTDAAMDKSQIDEVILVGGSTRIPKIQELVQKFFNGKELNRGINPDEAVAYGAAIQAAIIVGDDQTQDLVLLDVTSLTMGIETYGGIMTKIIPRNTRIPVKRSKTFSTVEDNQDRVSIFIYQGERDIAKKNVLLGQFDLDGIERAPRGEPKIDVSFEVDQNNIIKVTAEDKKSQKKNEILISNSDSRLSPEEVERMIKDSEKYANEDKELKEKIEAKNEFESTIYQVKSLKEKKKDELSSDVLSTVEQAVEDALKWIEDNQTADTADFKQKKSEFDETVKDFMKEAGEQPPPDGSSDEQPEETDHDEL